MFYLTIVNKILRHCHSWLARQYFLLFWYLHHYQQTFPSQRRSQNAEKFMHIKGRLLDQAMILFNCIPLHMGSSLKGKNLLPEGANYFLYEQFLIVWKITFITLSDLPWMLLFLLRMCGCYTKASLANKDKKIMPLRNCLWNNSGIPVFSDFCQCHCFFPESQWN